MLLFDILYDYVTIRIGHNSHENKLKPSVKTKLSSKHSLILGKSYTFDEV